MNLYDKANLIITPNAYKASKIYAAKPNDGSGDLTFSRESAAMRRNDLGLWESVSNNIPRLHYPVGGGCPAWLLEPAATNLLTRSIAYSNAVWTKQNSGTTFTLTDNFATAPDGTLTACKYEFTAMDSAGKFFSVYQAPTVAATTYTTSIWMKGAVGGEKIYLYGSLLGTPTLITLTADWVLYTVTNTVTAGAKTFIIGGEFGASGMGALAAGTIYLWNSQVETGSVATSPIITAGSTVTRVADAPIANSFSNVIPQTEGGFFLEFEMPSIVGGGVLAELANISNQNLNFQCSGNTLFWYSNAGGFSCQTTIAANTRYKALGLYKANAVQFWVNGVLVESDLTSLVHSSLSKLSLGCSIGAAYNVNIKIFESELTPYLDAAEAIALTTI